MADGLLLLLHQVDIFSMACIDLQMEDNMRDITMVKVHFLILIDIFHGIGIIAQFKKDA